MQSLVQASFCSKSVLVSNYKSRLPPPSWGVPVSVVRGGVWREGGWHQKGKGLGLKKDLSPGF